MSLRSADWVMALAVSLAAHVGVSALYGLQNLEVPQVARSAGGMTVIDGGLVNSVASPGAAQVAPSTVRPAPVREAVPAQAEPVSPVQAQTVPREMEPESTRAQVPMAAPVEPSSQKPAETGAPVSPRVAEPVEAKPQQPVREKRSAPASSRSDTAGSQSRSRSQARQTGSGGRDSAADGRAAESGYASRVLARIQRAKRCTAAIRGKRGRVHVSITLNRSGRMTGARVTRGSGSRALDREALSLVRRAAPFPAFPAAIRKSRLSYTVPLVYRGC